MRVTFAATISILNGAVAEHRYYNLSASGSPMPESKIAQKATQCYFLVAPECKAPGGLVPLLAYRMLGKSRIFAPAKSFSCYPA